MNKYIKILLTFPILAIINCGSGSSDEVEGKSLLLEMQLASMTTNSQLYEKACHSEIDNTHELIENIVILSNVEHELFSDLLLLFSEQGTKPLFDTTVSVGEEGSALLEKNYNNIIMKNGNLFTSLKPCFDATTSFFEEDSTSSKKNKQQVFYQKSLLKSISSFFIGFMGGTIENTRKEMLLISKDSYIIQEEMYRKAKFMFSSTDFGNSAKEFYSKLQSGEFSDKLNIIQNSLAEDVDSEYSWKREGLKEKGELSSKGNRLHKEGIEGLKKGIDFYTESASTIIGGVLPKGDAFSQGYDYAKNTIDIVNATEKDGIIGGVWKYTKNTGTKKLEDKVRTYLSSVKDKLGEITEDGIIDLAKKMTNSIYGNLSNLYHHFSTKKEKEQLIQNIENGIDKSENNKIIDFQTHEESIINPNIGLVALENESEQLNSVTIVSYPKEDEKTILNINSDNSSGMFTYFINDNEEYMGAYNGIERSVNIDITEYSISSDSQTTTSTPVPIPTNSPTTSPVPIPTNSPTTSPVPIPSSTPITTPMPIPSNSPSPLSYTPTPEASSIMLTYDILEDNEYSIVYRVYANVSNVTQSTTISMEVNQATVSNPNQTINNDSSIYWDVVVLENDAIIFVSREDSGFTKRLLLEGKGVKKDESTNSSETAYNYNGTYKGSTTTTSTPYVNDTSTLASVVSEAMCQSVKVTIIIEDSTIRGEFGEGSYLDEIKGYTISNSQIKGTTSKYERIWSGNLAGIPKNDPKYNSTTGNGATITGTWSLDNKCSGTFNLKQI